MALNWDDFSSSATVHGLRFINKESSTQRRIVWGTLVLIATGFLLWQVKESVGAFFQFKVNTVVHLTNDGKMKYPAITICNANTLRKSKLQELKNDPRVQRLMQLSKNFMFGIKQTVNGTKNSSSLDLSGMELRNVFFELGHNMESTEKGGMLEFCRSPHYGNCSSKDFVRALTYSGLCYTLNSNSSNGKYIYAGASGRFSAVKIGLSIQVDEYTLSIGNSESVGVSLLIHDQSEPPLADTHGVLIGPGVRASIGIKKTKFESMKHPYESKCRDKKLSPKNPYSRLACLRVCAENFVIKKCKCTMPVDSILDRPNVPVCNMLQSFLCAIPAATELFPEQRNLCNCPFACQSIEYTTTISKAPYPTEPRGRQQAIIDLKKMKENVTEKNIQKRLKFRRNNYIVLEIFYEKMDYMTIKQIPASKTVGLIATIGGLLGITLGASLLTVIEMIDFVIFYATKKLCAKLKRRTDITTNPEGKSEG